MKDVLISAREVSARYGRREVFHAVSFHLSANQSLGVIGPNGAGKTTLLRILAGLIIPSAGELRISGLSPRHAVARIGTAYFAGDFTLPGLVRACDWGRLAAGETLTRETRRIRTLSRGSRQMLGLRTVLARPHLGLIVLDEPWEALDPDGAKWLSSTVAAKRDRGAAVVVSSQHLHDLAGVCDAYLFLVNQRGTVLKAHELSPVGPVTSAILTDMLERLRGDRTGTLRAVS
jgi:ABC-2 type transport system ATP-binding protein